MQKIRYGVWMILACFFILLSLPTESSAHAFIVKSTPAENEILKTPPSKMSIQFNETIQPSFHSLKVLNDSGERVDQDTSHINKKNDTILEGDLESNLPDGTYTVQWSIVSSDGHPVNGTIPFQIGDGNGTISERTASSNGYFPHLDMIVIRWIQYLSLAIYLGIHFFNRFIYKKMENNQLLLTNRTKWLLWISYIGFTACILLELPLQITIDAGVSWLHAFEPSLIKEVLHTSNFGSIWKSELPLLILVGIITILNTRKKFTRTLWSTLTMIGVCGLLLAKVFLGHAASSENKTLTIAMDFLHVVAVSLWIGSLLALVLCFPKNEARKSKNLYWMIIRRFSNWGVIFVTIILVTGVYTSFQYIPTFHSLFYSSYGQILIAKIILLLCMIGFAIYNFWCGKHKEKIIGKSVWWEFSIGIIVLILAAILTNLPTGLSAPGVIDKTIKTETGDIVSLQITPNVIGKNEFSVKLTKNGRVRDDIEQVTLTLTCLDMDMGETVIEIPKKDLKASKPIEGVISMAGRWKVHVHGLTKSLESIDADFTIIAGSP